MSFCLGRFDQLSEVDVDGVEPAETAMNTSAASGMASNEDLRSDSPSVSPQSQQLMGASPDTDAGMIAVPRILTSSSD